MSTVTTASLNQHETIENFLAATAAKRPTPGGGSVAALAGALAGAIGEMVLSYSIGKKDLLAFDIELKQAASDLRHARAMLLQLMIDDQEAYTEMTAVRKLNDGPDKTERLSQTVAACIRCPQAIGATAVAILMVCDRVVDKVNPWLLSDLAVSADLATAAARCASYNVKVNLSSVRDDGQRKRFADETDLMVARAIELVKSVSPKIMLRAANGN